MYELSNVRIAYLVNKRFLCIIYTFRADGRTYNNNLRRKRNQLTEFSSYSYRRADGANEK